MQAGNTGHICDVNSRLAGGTQDLTQDAMKFEA